MVNKKRFSTFFIRYVSIAIIFLFVGWLAGYNSNLLSPDKISLLLKTTSSQLDLLNLQFDFVGTSFSNCSTSSEFIKNVNQQVGAIGKVLQEYEEKGIKNDFYYFMKSRYHLFQIRLYMLYKSYIDKCKPKQNVILYFWDNNNNSIKQGHILDSLVEKYRDTSPLHVFAVQYNFSSSYAFIQQFYNITYGPSLVINYNWVLKNISNASVIEKYLVNVSK